MSLPLKIFSGSSHPTLAKEITKFLHMKLGEMVLTRFASNEIYARPEQSVRGCDVYIVQTCTSRVNEDLMELFIMLDAVKRSFAEKIHVVLPHYGYARQDRVAYPREPISAKLVADLLSASGADHVITMNLHSDQEQGFFDFPVDNINASKLFVDYFKRKKIQDLVIVAPDTGSAKNAKKFADQLGADLAILHKVRPSHNVAEVTQVVGDVTNRTCLIYDDMIDTAGTVVAGRDALLKKGANAKMYLAATHAVFSPPAIERLKAANFTEVVVTNSIPVEQDKMFPGLTVLSVAELLAKTIKNVNESRSVSML